MQGQAQAPAAGEILNAIATWTGSSFAIDEYVTATVELRSDGPTRGRMLGNDGADTRLIERCLDLVTERYGNGEAGTVETESDVPMAAGLKSSSAAANATILATLDALGAVDEVDRTEAVRLGVEADRDVGVSVTGCFDDASASMLGGLTVTDNQADEMLARDEVSWDVLVWTPPERAFSADADIERCRRMAPVAELIAEHALAGDYGRAMTVNGLAFCPALEFPTEPIVEAMPDVEGVSLSGTGSSYTAVGDRAALESVAPRWRERDGDVWFTTTQSAGASVL